MKIKPRPCPAVLASSRFAVGSALRYAGLGAGIVDEELVRDFEGHQRVFLVLRFPHRGDMTAQVPLGEPSMEARLRPVLGVKQMLELLKTLGSDGGPLARTYDERSSLGEAALKEGEPEDWAALLRSYATGRRSGLQMTDSDGHLVRSAQERLAAELACGEGYDYPDALVFVRECYRTASTPPAE
jgi:RNA polymerase-interacting CarD/CdnL/TRCF family regulator